jgi:hypothetical protein
MGYESSTIEELKNGLFKASIVYTGIIYGTWCEHESFKTINECKEYLLEKRCPKLDIKYIANLPEGVVDSKIDDIKIPKAPKLYKDVVKK